MIVLPVAEPSEDLVEAEVQRRLVNKKNGLLYQLCIPFWRIGQKDARGTQDPGVADIVCFPRRPWRCVLWLECKRSRKWTQRPEQKIFQAEVEAAGEIYLIVNDAQVVIDFISYRGPRPSHTSS